MIEALCWIYAIGCCVVIIVGFLDWDNLSLSCELEGADPLFTLIVSALLWPIMLVITLIFGRI